jgi:hypothetical protein
MSTVIEAFGPHARMTTEQALCEAQAAAGELAEVIVVGIYKGGELYVRSGSPEGGISCRDALWLLEKAKQWALDG